MSAPGDYGERRDGAHNCWTARLVRGPFVTDRNTGRRFHGGQVAASAGHQTRDEAFSAAERLIIAHPREWNRKGIAIVEPGFYSSGFMPVAERLEWTR